jgi:hypothetical protein
VRRRLHLSATGDSARSSSSRSYSSAQLVIPQNLPQRSNDRSADAACAAGDPLTFEAVPESAKNVPPKELSVIALLELILPSAANPKFTRQTFRMCGQPEPPF